jgi:hypothetical protein
MRHPGLAYSVVGHSMTRRRPRDEDRSLRDIFTLDARAFSTYRVHGLQKFRIIPEPR